MLPQMLLWLLAVQACGMAVLPLALRMFRSLPDGGYGLAKPLGLLLVTYLIWMPGMLGYLEYRRSTVLLVLVLVAAGCWVRWGAEALDWLAHRRRIVGLEEAVLLGAGLAGAYVRAFNADIIGQEKFMDLAFFNGFLAANDLPAEDPWLAGYGMPYYPFGYLLLGLPSKLAGLPAAYGYNLALVLVFALTILLTAGLVANLVALLRRQAGRASSRVEPSEAVVSGSKDQPDSTAWTFGLIAALLVAVCGNLVGPLEVLAARGIGGPEFWKAVGVRNLQASASPTGWLPGDGGWWWHASRVIPMIQPDGITEFPYFSFLLGDLHPHFTALPLLLLILGLTLALLLERRPWREPPLVFVAALSLGVPLAANTWDVATFWAFYGLTGLLVGWRLVVCGERPIWRPFVWTLGPIPLGILLFSPYFVGYASQPLGLALVTDQTPLISLLIIFGPLLLLCSLLGLRLLRQGAHKRPAGWQALLLGGLAALGLAAAGRSTAALALALLSLSLAAGVRQLQSWLADDKSAARGAALYLLSLVSLGLALLVSVEILYIHDSFGTRMNTVFKFYYHVWLLLGLAAGPAVALWLDRSAFAIPGRLARGSAAAALVSVLLLGLVYPLAATWTKSDGFRGPATLDGAAFLERAKPTEAAAIQWLAGQTGRPVVLEAVGGDYEEFARVSTFSGLPTVLGWVGHQLQWRGQSDEYNRRQQDVDLVYRRGEREESLRILRRYQVRYVFVGSLERDKYGGQVEDRLARWLSPVFRREGAAVLMVPTEGARS
jgi:YYY domain-containing protein